MQCAQSFHNVLRAAATTLLLCLLCWYAEEAGAAAGMPASEPEAPPLTSLNSTTLPSPANATLPVNAASATKSGSVSAAPAEPSAPETLTSPLPATNGTAAPATNGTAAPATNDTASPAAHGTAPSAAATGEVPPLQWEELAPGLLLGCAQLPESKEAGTEAYFIVLRIDPSRYAFTLNMASKSGASLSLREWSENFGLYAGINAGMYLPDAVTSIGYARNGAHVNNGRIGGKLGAFFVAEPTAGKLARADILERDAPGWREKLDQYGLAVQNYRLVDSRGKTLWPEGGPKHSIAAVARDTRGRILFLLSQEPLEATRFAWYVQNMSLGATVTLYVEGGAQAGLFALEPSARTATRRGASSYPSRGGVLHVWKGRKSLLGVRGNPDAPLPNILGILQESAAKR